MWIWYYDRQGIIQCSGINFIQDLPRFMALFHDERVTHYGLQGRATNVVPVTSEALAKKYGNLQDGMVAKIFWGEASRTSEPEILDKVKEIAKVHNTVKDHIPDLLWHHTFTNPTSAIREALGVPDPTTGSRVLYILIFRKLHPITKLHGKELFDVWYQCILCHITLWKEGVYHRDISPGNLMWYRRNGKLIGVLNDYDLSSLANTVGPQGNERTGTVPFMALDLLTAKAQRGEVEHLYCHDLESFIWVFAWIFLHYRQGVLLPRRLRPFDNWATLGALYVARRNWSLWELLVDCLKVLDTAAYDRRELINAEESVSDMDDLLGKFTGTMAWVKLSNPSPS
ncbi:hypothetical protein BDR05DRAFT_971087 [Suillus weaverae]|nr:hypothetical protein BDR05DRAFT_971087 [Suillus weaverae]